jgi:group I intron endonuclease
MGTVYKIENLVNGKCYYGQTINWNIRKGAHLSYLRNGKHHNQHLQRSWYKHGEQAFLFTVISDSEADSQLDQLEKQLIEIFQTMNPKYGYNKESGGNLYKIHSPETREKRRQALLGRKCTPEHRENMRQGKLGKKSLSGHINKNLGKKHSLERIENNRKAQLSCTAKPVYSHSEDFIYPSITAAATAYGITRSNLSQVIRKNSSYKGMKFSYLI